MMYNDKVEIVKKAINKYGRENQLVVAIEEMAELQKELCKVMRQSPKIWNVDRITEEMADVRLMLFQLQMIFKIPTDAVQAVEELKLSRLNERMIRDDAIRNKR